MITECNNAKQPKLVTLVFKRENILYDIKNYAFIEGDIIGEDNIYARQLVSDIAEDGNVDRVSRILNLAYTESVEMLYPYTKQEILDDMGELNNDLEEPDEYKIQLNLPYAFSSTTVNLLKGLIHEYLVCRVIGDWMSITNPNSQTNWDRKTLAIKAKIQTSLMSRSANLKRKLKPF